MISVHTSLSRFSSPALFFAALHPVTQVVAVVPVRGELSPCTACRYFVVATLGRRRLKYVRWSADLLCGVRGRTCRESEDYCISASINMFLCCVRRLTCRVSMDMALL
eukprot:7387323-Heterocapsa_arctica.AAC.1